MAKRKIVVVHPRKAQWAMRDFINSIHNLDFEAYGWDSKTQQTIHQHIRPRVRLIADPAENFSVCVDDRYEKFFRIRYNLEFLNNPSAGWRKSFTRINSVANGFASITLAILHELGHLHTEQEFEGYDRDFMMKAIFFMAETQEEMNEMYYDLPDEKNATEWAVAWLMDADHRKQAKAFEKKFFECMKQGLTSSPISVIIDV